jgi:DNA-binding CsgD family transcriptional regulator
MTLRQATQDRQFADGSANMHGSQAFNPANDHFLNNLFAAPAQVTPQATPAPASDASLAQTLAACALDAMASGVIIIDQYARVLHRNAAADEVLASRRCVAVDSGHVTVTHMPDVRQFSQALSKAAAGQRSMIALGAMSDALVAVVPLRVPVDAPKPSPSTTAAGRATGRTGKSQALATKNTPCSSAQHFALIFSRTDMCEALSLKPFAGAYELTPTEERVLALISTGQTVPEMAKRFNLGAATIRTHVRNICNKTNCHGLREIVTRLAVLPALKIEAF